MSHPLTEAQEGLWFFQRLDPSNPILNAGQYLELTGELDVARFQAAVAQAVAEAPALALVIRDTDAGPRQAPGTPPVPGFRDFTASADPEAAALALMAADSASPADPGKGGLAAFILCKVGPERYFWYQRIHHLATDGYAFVLFTDRVARLYAGPGGGPDGGPPLAPLERAFEVDAEYRASPRREADRAFWLAEMEGLPEIQSLAPQGSGAPLSGPTFLRVTRPLPAGLLEGLKALATRAGTGWPDALTALCAAYCQRFTGGAEAVVGVPFMGRLGSKAARVPAMVMNVLPLRVAPDETAPLETWIAAMSALLAAGRRHGRYRSEQLRRDLGRIGGSRRLFGALVNVQPFDMAPKIPGLDVRLHILGAGAVDDITFTFRGDAAEGLVFETDANPALYSPEAVEAHSLRLAAFLTSATSAARLVDIPTVSPDEARWLELSRRATRHPLPDLTLVQLIEAQFARTPGAEALRFEGSGMDYAELDRRSAALAAQLVAAGAGPDRIVALALERGFALLVALVAVLRAGAGYLPLDPAHPDERLARIMARANPAAILTEPGLAPRFPGALVLDAKGAAAPSDPAPPDPAASLARTAPGPDDLAYVIFTSGSTGEPKGVEISHRAIVNRLIWMRDFYGFDSSDRILQKTPATFDVSVWEFFLPLISGATLVIAAPGAHRDPSAIAALIRSESVTTLHFVPSMLSAFLAAPASAGLALRRVFCSGEELTPDQRARFHRRIGAGLHNLYGPTEAAVDVSFWPAGPEDRTVPLPIGFPVWNTALEVLDDQLREVPDGVAGQLYLGGVQLARGYLGRPDLTEARFIADPRTPGGRLYMTGDLARRRPDGAVVYLGRTDHQVKIRGLRIELGEVEAALMDHPATAEAVVMAQDGRLVAWVVPPPGEAVLRAHLATRLPDYMVPSAIVGLAALPVTGNGKLDRAALPAPVFSHSGSRAPTPVEARLATLFAEVLRLPSPPGPEADFFALGGDSLSAVRLSLRIEEEFGHDPGLGTLFDRPVLAALAEAIREAGADHGLAPLMQLAAEPALAVETGSGFPIEAAGAPLLPGAIPPKAPALLGMTAMLPQPLALIHPAGGLGWGYRGLAAALPGRRILALQAPMLDPDLPMPDSLAALASGYVDLLRTEAPGARWHLAGWSVGGIIAQGMAAEFSRRGHPPGMVALLDSYPADVWRDEPEPDAITAMRALLAVAGYNPEDYPQLCDQASILHFLKASGSALGNLPEPALEGVMRTVAGLNRLVRRHEHLAWDGTLTHVTAALDHQGTGLVPALWQPYAGAVEVLEVPFRHPELTSPDAVAQIAPLLAARMARIEREISDGTGEQGHAAERI